MLGKITFDLLIDAILFINSICLTGFGDTRLNIPFLDFSELDINILATSSSWIQDCHWFPASFGLGAWFGSGNQWQSWIHIQDLVQLFIFALDHPGIYNGVAPNPVTQKQLIKAISRQYKMPQWLPGIPAFLIKIAMGKMASILFDSIRVSSIHVQKQGFSFIFPSIQEALQDLLPLNSKK